MDALDLLIAVVVLAAGIHGLRLGAAVQVLSFVGGFIGVALGILLVLVVCPHLHGEFLRTFVALLLLLLPSSLTWGLGRELGAKIWQKMRGRRFATLDAAGGAVVGAAGVLVVVWIVASVLANSQFTVISSQIQGSTVLRSVTRVLPPLPTELAAVQRLLNDGGVPVPYLGIIQPVGGVPKASRAQVEAAIQRAGSSTVLVIATGACGGSQVIEGSGFVVAPGVVVTNAHVVAGSTRITVEDHIQSYPATPVYFDPEFDLSVLRVPYLSLPPLTVDPTYATRGTKATVLGYPGGGPFNAQPAGVMLNFDPVSSNIYGTRNVQRDIYELQAVVRAGNSGGPLIGPTGEVIGVVFSRDATNDDIGFALASPGVLRRIEIAEARPAKSRVSTGSCVSG